MNKKKSIAIASLVLAGILSLSACGSSSSTSTSSGSGSTATSNGTTEIKATNASKSPAAALARKDTLVVGLGDMNGIWSDVFTDSSYDHYADELMFNTLLIATPDGQANGDAADYKVSSDGLTYTFTLKDGVKYWDGKPATASDIEFLCEVMADPNYDGQLDISTADIQGFDAYKNGSATSISGIKVVDDKTIQFTLTTPNASTLWTLGQLPLMEKAYYGADYKKGNVKTVEDKLAQPMGSGQYKFVSYDPATGLKLVANDNYFKGAPKIKNVELSVTAQGQELQRVQAGEVDLEADATCSEDNVASLKKSGFINAYYYPINAFGMVQWNLQDPKYSDVRVRQALAYGLNRAAVVKQVYGQYATVTNVPLPTGSWGYSTDGTTNYTFSIDKAKALLKEAGWAINSSTQKLEKDGKPFVIDFTAKSGNAVTDAMLPVMKEDYAKLGIDVNIESSDFSTMLKGYNNGKLDACFMGQTLTTPDPDTSNLFMTGASQNFYKFSDKDLDALYQQEQRMTDTTKRKAIFAKINKLLNQQLPMMPIYQRNMIVLYNTRVQNVAKMGTFRDPFLDLYQYTLKG
ncbi:MAG: ABC transporter substrate-binding protein [Ethanoligenens sp.]|uniref:ABC transporter substrate-binding protein n=1 Tax=Ethanoligenens sp. TaxID=2099655 RepID=UPI0039EB1E2B